MVVVVLVSSVVSDMNVDVVVVVISDWWLTISSETCC